MLILDDLSYVRRDQAETPVRFELIAERYERKSIAITANTPFSQWNEVFGDPAMTIAGIDRLVHHATILEMDAWKVIAAEARKSSGRLGRVLRKQRSVAPVRTARMNTTNCALYDKPQTRSSALPP